TLADDVVAELADGDHEVTVTATDPAGNVGSTTGTITIDTVAPVVGLDDVDSNVASPELTGTIDDPSATVTVTVDGVDYEAVNNGDGTWTLPAGVLPDLADGDYTISVTATDAAGNTGTAQANLNIDTSAQIVAFDNVDDAFVNALPLQVGDDINVGSHTYLLLASLAGLNLQLGSPGIGFTIDEGHTGDMTFNYSALISADALADYVLVLQKFDEATGQWTAVTGPGQADLLSLALFGGTTITVDGLEEGQYRAFMAFDGLLGAGLLGTLSGSMDLYDPSQIGGYEVVAAEGNVITDEGINGETDIITDTTVVSMVNGEAVVDGGTTIVGTYGTLVIHPDGSYTYTPFAGDAALGQVDQFAYTLLDTATGNTANAILYLHIDSYDVDMTWNPADPSQPATVDIVATDDLNVAEINPQALLVGDDIPSG
ncbi:BapA/Bap/LapF family large adhesin, partial [Acinetobacter haemolyticus]|uniref:BapA/Bap/LapF family large adhesin n=1 Tax=Acinetobacter haemolyticus TaxID=29430 RepID=UPI0024DE3867